MENTFGKNIIPENDQLRIEALKRYKILDTPPENAFDNVATLATQIFKVPISLISLVDEEQVYFKANIGMGRAKSASRGVSLCSLAVLQTEVTVFENAPEEPCLLTNPNVAGSLGLKFYAGAPLITHDGFLIGTLCIIDQTPRVFSTADREIMQSLAKIVMDEIELRLSATEEVEKQLSYIEETSSINEELTATNEELYQMQLQLLSANASLAESEELKNIAIEQAKLGLWYIDADTREFISSDRLKEFFGFKATEPMTFEAAAAQIPDDHRNTVINALNKAMSDGTAYNLEYPVIGYHDQRRRWLRSSGKLNPAVNGKKAYISGTILDITEQKEDDQRKNDFISMVSHELKTPLTSMSGYLQMLTVKSAKTEDTFAIGVLDRVNLQVKKMVIMINGFLNMKRLESGKIPLYKQRFDLAQLIQETEEESVATISSHKILFEPIDAMYVEADRDKIGQVISNLISNAVKYSDAGTPIRLTCINSGERVRIGVHDQGRGVSKDDQVKLFDRFYRVENKEMETINGFGIGLYLCDEIIKRHEGHIWIESEVGAGANFYFELPV
jgi:two-component system sensor histidine kinase VicK